MAAGRNCWKRGGVKRIQNLSGRGVLNSGLLFVEGINRSEKKKNRNKGARRANICGVGEKALRSCEVT